MQVNSVWKTEGGQIAIIKQRVPKLRQYFGVVKERGRETDTIWYDSGVNAENPDWDLVEAISPKEDKDAGQVGKQ